MHNYVLNIQATSLDSDDDEDFKSKHDETIYKTFLQSAKFWLKKYLENINYSAKSISLILRYFNDYLETKNPFPLERTNSRIDFSWIRKK